MYTENKKKGRDKGRSVGMAIDNGKEPPEAPGEQERRREVVDGPKVECWTSELQETGTWGSS